MKFYEQSVKIQTDKNVEGAQAPVVFFHRKTAKKGVIVISIEMTKEECLERLLNAYSHHYDIVRDVTVEGGSYPAEAIFFLRDENYLISRKHVLNAVENHEYVYFYLTDHLDAQTLRQQIELSRTAGMQRIHPNKEHMSSFVTLVILADTIDPEAKALIQKTRFRKNFRLALHGWMEYHIAAMEISTQSFLCNPAGKEAKKLLELNFAPKHIKKGRVS